MQFLDITKFGKEEQMHHLLLGQKKTFFMFSSLFSNEENINFLKILLSSDTPDIFMSVNYCPGKVYYYFDILTILQRFVPKIKKKFDFTPIYLNLTSNLGLHSKTIFRVLSDPLNCLSKNLSSFCHALNSSFSKDPPLFYCLSSQIDIALERIGPETYCSQLGLNLFNFVKGFSKDFFHSFSTEKIKKPEELFCFPIIYENSHLECKLQKYIQKEHDYPHKSKLFKEPAIFNLMNHSIQNRIHFFDVILKQIDEQFNIKQKMIEDDPNDKEIDRKFEKGLLKTYCEMKEIGSFYFLTKYDKIINDPQRIQNFLSSFSPNLDILENFGPNFSHFILDIFERIDGDSKLLLFIRRSIGSQVHHKSLKRQSFPYLIRPCLTGLGVNELSNLRSFHYLSLSDHDRDIDFTFCFSFLSLYYFIKSLESGLLDSFRIIACMEYIGNPQSIAEDIYSCLFLKNKSGKYLASLDFATSLLRVFKDHCFLKDQLINEGLIKIQMCHSFDDLFLSTQSFLFDILEKKNFVFAEEMTKENPKLYKIAHLAKLVSEKDMSDFLSKQEVLLQTELIDYDQSEIEIMNDIDSNVKSILLKRINDQHLTSSETTLNEIKNIIHNIQSSIPTQHLISKIDNTLSKVKAFLKYYDEMTRLASSIDFTDTSILSVIKSDDVKTWEDLCKLATPEQILVRTDLEPVMDKLYHLLYNGLPQVADSLALFNQSSKLVHNEILKKYLSSIAQNSKRAKLLDDNIHSNEKEITNKVLQYNNQIKSTIFNHETFINILDEMNEEFDLQIPIILLTSLCEKIIFSNPIDVDALIEINYINPSIVLKFKHILKSRLNLIDYTFIFPDTFSEYTNLLINANITSNNVSQICEQLVNSTEKISQNLVLAYNFAKNQHSLEILLSLIIKKVLDLIRNNQEYYQYIDCFNSKFINQIFERISSSFQEKALQIHPQYKPYCKHPLFVQLISSLHNNHDVDHVISLMHLFQGQEQEQIQAEIIDIIMNDLYNIKVNCVEDEDNAIIKLKKLNTKIQKVHECNINSVFHYEKQVEQLSLLLKFTEKRFYLIYKANYSFEIKGNLSTLESICQICFSYDAYDLLFAICNNWEIDPIQYIFNEVLTCFKLNKIEAGRKLIHEKQIKTCFRENQKMISLLSHPIPGSITTGKWRGYISFFPIHQSAQLLLKGGFSVPIPIEQILALEEAIHAFANGEEEIAFYATTGTFANYFGSWSDLSPGKRNLSTAIRCIIFPLLSFGHWESLWSSMKINKNLKQLYKPIIENLYQFAVDQQMKVTCLEMEKHLGLYRKFINHSFKILDCCSSWKEMLFFLSHLNDLFNGKIVTSNSEDFPEMEISTPEKVYDSKLSRIVEKEIIFLKECEKNNIPFLPNSNKVISINIMASIINMTTIAVIDLENFDLALSIVLEKSDLLSYAASKIVDDAGLKLPKIMEDMSKSDPKVYKILIGQIVGQIVGRAEKPSEVPPFILGNVRIKEFAIQLLVQFGFLEDALNASEKYEIYEYCPQILRQAKALDDKKVIMKCLRFMKKIEKAGPRI